MRAPGHQLSPVRTLPGGAHTHTIGGPCGRTEPTLVGPQTHPSVLRPRKPAPGNISAHTPLLAPGDQPLCPPRASPNARALGGDLQATHPPRDGPQNPTCPRCGGAPHPPETAGPRGARARPPTAHPHAPGSLPRTVGPQRGTLLTLMCILARFRRLSVVWRVLSGPRGTSCLSCSR